jgi:type IV pilus assembly protein PilF
MKTTRYLSPRLAALGLAFQLTTLLGCATTDPAKVADNERRARSHYTLALNHLKEGRTGIAIRELLSAQKLSPSDPWIDLSLAEAYRLKNHTADSERHLKRALELRPDLHAAKLNLSALYIQTERYEEAVVLSQELLGDATFPVPWKGLTNQGYALYKLGRKQEAREALTHALEYHAKFWPAQLNLAILDEEEGRRLEALEALEEVLALKPGPVAEAECHYRIATLYISLGNRAKAVHHLSVASQTKPSGEWGKRSADYLKRLR